MSALSYDNDSLSSSCVSESSESCVVEDNAEEILVQEGRYNLGDINKEDSKLQNWSKWLGERKKQYRRIKKTLKKDPLFVHSDNVYEKRRKEKLIDSARSYVIFDKYRGDPKFWKTPKYLYEDCEKEVPLQCPAQDYFDRTVIDKNEPPESEFIGIPFSVQYEKGLIELDDDSRKKKTTFHKCNYFLDKKEELKYNVKLIEKFVPDIENLFVIGEPFPRTSSEKSPSVEDRFSEVTIIQHCVRGLRDNLDTNVDTRFPILKIQGIVIDKNIMKNIEDDFEQVIDFLDCSVNQLYLKNLVIENTGNVCVRYSWEQVEPYRNTKLPLQYSTRLTKRFFFPEKNDISPPGQITELPFYFKSREPGVYHETWILKTDPEFIKNKFIKFSLQGFVRVESRQRELLEIESYIYKCRLMTESCKLLDGIFVDSELEKPIPYDYLFYDKDVFLHNNPNYFYEFELVETLKELHESISDGEKWDLNINTLRDVILNKIEPVEDKRVQLTRLYELSNSLLKYNVKYDIDEEKYRGVYQILCSFANSIEREALQLRAVYRIGEFKSPSTTIHMSNERLSNQDLVSVKSGPRRSRPSSVLSKTRLSKNFNVKRPSSFISSGSHSGSYIDIIRDKSGSVESSKSSDQLQAQYEKTLKIKTYQHLSTAVDEITAIIESLNLFTKTN